MVEESIRQVLKDFGLTETEAEIYLFLSRHGALKGMEIAKGVKKDKAQVYHILRSLQAKGLAESTLEAPVRFTPVPFDNVVESAIKAKRDEAERIESTKLELLHYWKNLNKAKPELPSEKFVVLEGRSRIYSRIQQMILESKHRILSMLTVTALAQADAIGLFAESYDHLLKSNIQFRFLTEISAQNVEIMKNLFSELSKHKVAFQGKNPYLELKTFPRLLVKDEEEILLFLKPTTHNAKIEEDATCLWTNCKTLICGFTTIFEEMWRQSLDIETKIAEIEHADSLIKTYSLADPEKAKMEYFEILRSAKEEILVLTSSQGLLDLWREKSLLEGLNDRGVIVKILAPITRENIHAAEQLLRFSTVKHVPANYVGMTIVDGKHLFQSRAVSIDQERLSLVPHFFTKDVGYVEKMKSTLNEMWDSAQVPSNTALEPVKGSMGYSIFPIPERERKRMISPHIFTVIDAKPPGTISEKDVIDKITKARNYPIKNPAKDINVMYASQGSAIIHLPKQFNLPNMLIRVDHIEKQSSFGEGDAIEIHLQQETPQGLIFVATGGLGDNPKGVLHRKLLYAGTPLENNYHLVEKDKLQVRVFGNTLFAAWAIPIQFRRDGQELPPGCLIFEGHGNVKTSSDSVITGAGMKIEREQNWFDAFVTFTHPESKYSGPGTDGFFARDLIVKMTPC